MCIRMSMSKSPPPPPPVHDLQSKPGAMTRKRKLVETFLIKQIVVGKPDIVNLLEAQPCSYTKHKFAIFTNCLNENIRQDSKNRKIPNDSSLNYLEQQNLSTNTT